MFGKVMELKRQSSPLWLVGGNALYACTQWILIIVLANFGQVTMVGQFSFGLAIATPFFVFLSLQVRTIYVTDVENHYKIGHLLGTRLLTSFGALICICILIFILENFMITQQFLIVFLISLIKFIESLDDIFHAVFQKQGLFRTIGFSLLVRGSMYLLSSLISLFYINNLTIVLLSMIVCLTGITAFDFKKVYALTSLKLKFRRAFSLKLANISLPLGIGVALIALIETSPRFFISKYFGDEILGVFTILIYFTLAGSIVVNSLGQASMSKLAMSFHTNIKLFKKQVLYLICAAILISLGLGTGSWIFGSYVLRSLFNLNNIDYTHLLTISLLLSSTQYLSSVLGYALTAAKKYKIQPFVLSCSYGISLLSSLYLIPNYQLLGGILSLNLAYLIQLVAFLVYFNSMKLKENKLSAA
jgi:O-antigen/teichoic acid export membrane protein